jgi:hypothetical protein
MAMKWQFKFFVITVIAALILPEIFRDGIFMDGNLYASVAVNFARGLREEKAHSGLRILQKNP